VFNPHANPDSKSFVFDKMERGKWYKVKLNNNSKKGDEFYNFSFSSVSSFDAETDVVEPLSIDDIKAYFIDRYRKLGELKDWHESNASMGDDGVSSNNYDVVLTEGIVQSIDEADENSFSHKITIDDAESLGLDDDDITIWYDKNFSIDFSVYSRVLVFGTTKRKEKQDYATEEYTGEMGSVSLTGLGFIVIDSEEPDNVESEVAGDEEEYAEIEESEEDEEINEDEEDEEGDDSSSETDEEWG